jgi:hypothetical protein
LRLSFCLLDSSHHVPDESGSPTPGLSHQPPG